VALKLFVRASSWVGDLNNDGVVNIVDLSMLLTDWGTANAAADLRGDGVVGISDLPMLLSHWGGKWRPVRAGRARRIRTQYWRAMRWPSNTVYVSK